MLREACTKMRLFLNIFKYDVDTVTCGFLTYNLHVVSSLFCYFTISGSLTWLQSCYTNYLLLFRVMRRVGANQVDSERPRRFYEIGRKI